MPTRTVLCGRPCALLLALGDNPGIGLANQLGESQEVVLAVAVRLLPFAALLVLAAMRDAVPYSVGAFILPDGNFRFPRRVWCARVSSASRIWTCQP